MTTRISLSTLFLIYVIRGFMDAATRNGSRNPIVWLARTERIHREEMRKMNNEEIVVKCTICGKPFVLVPGAKNTNACPSCHAEAQRNSGIRGKLGWREN